MTKQLKVIFFSLIAMVAILAFLASFFFAKSRNPKTATETTSPKPSSSATQVKTSTPQPSQSTAVTKLASSGDRPSGPQETYTIERGDSLLGVAQKTGVSLEQLSQANGITDADKILTGQILIIPQGAEIIFTVDNTRATEIQKNVDNGRTLWRLSPDEVSRSDNAGAFGLKISDIYTVKNRAEGTAEVTVNADGKTYLIKLTQPITRGDKGIWAIISIAPTSA